jgi:hypothetical protein
MMVLTERGTYYKLERIKNKPIKKKKIFWRWNIDYVPRSLLNNEYIILRRVHALRFSSNEILKTIIFRIFSSTGHLNVSFKSYYTRVCVCVCAYIVCYNMINSFGHVVQCVRLVTSAFRYVHRATYRTRNDNACWTEWIWFIGFWVFRIPPRGNTAVARRHINRPRVIGVLIAFVLDYVYPGKILEKPRWQYVFDDNVDGKQSMRAHVFCHFCRCKLWPVRCVTKTRTDANNISVYFLIMKKKKKQSCGLIRGQTMHVLRDDIIVLF